MVEPSPERAPQRSRLPAVLESSADPYVRAHLADIQGEVPQHPVEFSPRPRVATKAYFDLGQTGRARLYLDRAPVGIQHDTFGGIDGNRTPYLVFGVGKQAYGAGQGNGQNGVTHGSLLY